MEETLKAWAAGIVDGEGSVLIAHSKSTDYYYVLVCVVNNDENMISVLWDNWANKGTDRLLAFMSNAKTRIVCSGNSHKIIFNLIDTEAFLNDIKPYLVAKKDNAKVILEAISSIKHRKSTLGAGTFDETVGYTLKPYFNKYNHLWSRR